MSIIQKIFLLVLLGFIVVPLAAQKLSGTQQYDTTLMFVHSPRKASFYSAVLPGLGQAYNKKYWKIPILYAGGATIIYYLRFNQERYTFYRNLYIKNVANDPSDMPELAKRFSASQLKSRMDFWSHNRDYLVLGLAALYIANILDATVDAYLFDYDVSQDLSMNLKPTLFHTGYSYNLGLSCSLRF